MAEIDLVLEQPACTPEQTLRERTAARMQIDRGVLAEVFDKAFDTHETLALPIFFAIRDQRRAMRGGMQQGLAISARGTEFSSVNENALHQRPRLTRRIHFSSPTSGRSRYVDRAFANDSNAPRLCMTPAIAFAMRVCAVRLRLARRIPSNPRSIARRLAGSNDMTGMADR